MTAGNPPARGTPAPAPAEPVRLPRILGPIRPRPRMIETRLFVLVAITLFVGRVSLSLTETGTFELADARGLFVYIGVLLAAHLAQVLAGRRSDQVLLPTVGLLGGISLLLMQRLPQELVTIDVGGHRRWGSARSSWSGCAWPSWSRPRSAWSSARTAGCAATSTPGRSPASPCCC